MRPAPISPRQVQELDSARRLWIGNGAEYALHHVAFTGDTLLSIFRAGPPVPLTPDDVDSQLAYAAEATADGYAGELSLGPGARMRWAPGDRLPGGRAMKDSRIAVNGGRELAYTDFGDLTGPCVFFFHGAPTSRLRLLFLDEPFAERGLRVVAPDRPGYGRSSQRAFHPTGAVDEGRAGRIRRVLYSHSVVSGYKSESDRGIPGWQPLPTAPRVRIFLPYGAA